MGTSHPKRSSSALVGAGRERSRKSLDPILAHANGDAGPIDHQRGAADQECATEIGEGGRQGVDRTKRLGPTVVGCIGCSEGLTEVTRRLKKS